MLSATIATMAGLSGAVMKWASFTPRATEKNPNYGKPIQFQSPRQFRFGARVTF